MQISSFRFWYMPELQVVTVAVPLAACYLTNLLVTSRGWVLATIEINAYLTFKNSL